MKPDRGGFRMLRREQLLQELVHDTYKLGRKLKEPTRCPDCGATFDRGRWAWGVAPAHADEHRCPACQRERDHFPAGFVSLGGAFFREHRDEVMHLVKHCEEKEKAEHPMERIMAVEPSADGVEVTTTGTHLAREIAERVQHAYKGELEFGYNREDNLLRASWRR